MVGEVHAVLDSSAYFLEDGILVKIFSVLKDNYMRRHGPHLKGQGQSSILGVCLVSEKES